MRLISLSHSFEFGHGLGGFAELFSFNRAFWRRVGAWAALGFNAAIRQLQRSSQRNSHAARNAARTQRSSQRSSQRSFNARCTNPPLALGRLEVRTRPLRVARRSARIGLAATGDERSAITGGACALPHHDHVPASHNLSHSMPQTIRSRDEDRAGWAGEGEERGASACRRVAAPLRKVSSRRGDRGRR